MTVTSKTLYRGNASTDVNTDVYTVPSTSTTTVITNIAVNNSGSSSATFTIKMDSFDIHTATPIAANTTVYIDCKQVLQANATPKKIKAGASSANVIFHFAGVEIV